MKNMFKLILVFLCLCGGIVFAAEAKTATNSTAGNDNLTKAAAAGAKIISMAKLKAMGEKEMVTFLKTLSPQDMANVVAMVTSAGDADLASLVIDCSEVAINALSTPQRAPYVTTMKEVITVEVKVDVKGIVSIVPVERVGSKKEYEVAAETQKEDEKKEDEEQQEEGADQGAEGSSQSGDQGSSQEAGSSMQIDASGLGGGPSDISGDSSSSSGTDISDVSSGAKRG